ncbi:MAG: TRAP transporter large permease [Dehalobacterium sp.]
MITAIFIGSLLAFLLSGMPVAFAIANCTLLALWLTDVPLMVIAQQVFAANYSFPLLAIPLFILAGSVMTKGGVSDKLIEFCGTVVGGVHGGLSMVALLACGIFAAICGSSSATAAAIGSVMIPTMKEKGYKEEFAAGVVASGGALGMIIPPSLLMIVYGVAAEVSISELFMGGFIPGIFIMLVMMVGAWYISKRDGYKGLERFQIKNVFKSFKTSIWALLLPVIILGGIYSGLYTPTESAAIGVGYGLFVALFIYKDLNFSQIPAVLIDAVKSTAVVVLIMDVAGLFGWMLINLQIPQTIAAAFLGITNSPVIMLLIIMGLLLVVGALMNAGPAMIILAPILIPVAQSVGIDLVYFGVFMSICLTIGVITPPVGVDLFIISSVSGIPVERVASNSIIFIFIMIICTIITIYFPQIIMFLPNLLAS